MITSLQPIKEITQIGPYKILRCIGQGGMGVVYLAHDPRLDRQVAIKCLHTALFEVHYRERFKREAFLLAKLNHPHIVQIYDFVETTDQLALIMELVDGQNLQLYLREHIISFRQQMQWLTEIAQALAVAHDAGIIHRDLKAENILINKFGKAKISDFGIANSKDFNATLTDHVTGTYCSMSPEQAMGETVDFRSDLFSFGILAYQMLCGAHPFGDTSNKLQLMQRIILHPPISPSVHNPRLPEEICQLLAQLLSKNIDNRPANTHWVAAQWEKLCLLELAPTFDVDPTKTLPHTKLELEKNDLHAFSTDNDNAHQYTPLHTRVENPTNVTRNKLLTFIHQHTFTVILGVLTLLLGIGLWQLDPVEPRYIAVLPPTFTTSEMQDSQRELVKIAVYDAIQQSVLQLEEYYLIPHNEIIDVYASNNKEGLESIRRATAADELITTDIQCKMEACTITLSRLTLDDKKQENRLRVQNTKVVDVLTDNYLSVATIVQNNIGNMYSATVLNDFQKVDDQEYSLFLKANHIYRSQGASQALLNTLDTFQPEIKRLPAVQTLYKDVVIDLYFETKNVLLLKKLSDILISSSNKNEKLTYLYNLYYLQIAQNDFTNAMKTIETLKQMNASNSSVNELLAYGMMAKNDYGSALAYYKKSLSSKITANSFFNIANTYWYSGNTLQAKESLRQALVLSPTYYKANSLFGLIALMEGDIEKAKIAFEKVILGKPDDITNLSNLGLCYLLKGEYSQARELFSRAFKLAPHFNTLLLNQADAENLAGNTIESNKTYHSLINAVQTGGITSENLRNRSQAYAHLGNYSAALTDLQQLEKIDPQNIETTYTAALVHTLANNKASAILNIENTLKNGMNKIWFSFAWFDFLCSESHFVNLMRSQGEPDRCIHPLKN